MSIFVLIVLIIIGIALIWGFIHFVLSEVITDMKAAEDSEPLDDGIAFRMLDEANSVHCDHFKESVTFACRSPSQEV